MSLRRPENVVQLPLEVQRQVRRAYRTFRDNPNHPSLRFKPIHQHGPIYSGGISADHRAVGVLRVTDRLVLDRLALRL